MQNGKTLSVSAMKNIHGGEIITTPSIEGTTLLGAIFKCHCKDGIANPPYRNEWTQYYASHEEAIKDLNNVCFMGGECKNIGSIAI